LSCHDYFAAFKIMSDTAKPADGRATSSEVPIERYCEGRVELTTDRVAEETPVALTYHGVPHVVMLATPANLTELAAGFTWSEALVAEPSEIRSVELHTRDTALEVDVGVTPARFAALLRRQRQLSARTGCGLCGSETIADAIRPTPIVTATSQLSITELYESLAALTSQQNINAVTGAVHAAAWGVAGQGLQVVREDVGRHNALDKVIGALLFSQQLPSNGYLLITSRASYEMVQKAATVGVGLVVAVSAPTGLAVRLAHDSGLTLVGFARPPQHVVYTHSWRLVA
jgi:formate dehydrogenase accessory protein FdhD